MDRATFELQPLRGAYAILNFLEKMLREIGERENLLLLKTVAPNLVRRAKVLVREAKISDG